MATSTTRKTASASLLLALALTPALASADTIDTCMASSEQAQVLRDHGELRAAREMLVACSAPTCPGVIQRDCAEWLAAVERRLPTLVLRAHDGRGADVTDARVTLDGTLLPKALEGRAIPVDPGTHKLRVEPQGQPPIEQTLVVREGEKERVIALVLGPTPETPRPPEAPPPSRLTPPFWALVGVAAAGAGVYAGFGLRAKLAVDDMRDRCAPTCGKDEVDTARRDVVIANVAFGLGLAALTAATVVVLIPPKPRADRAALPLKIGVGPTSATLIATF